MAIKKFRYLIQLWDMAQNSFVLDEIDREAMKAPADAHHQKSLPG